MTDQTNQPNQHIEWAKVRALEYLIQREGYDRERCAKAIASFHSDMMKYGGSAKLLTIDDLKDGLLVAALGEPSLVREHINKL